MDGKGIMGKPQSFYTIEFGPISHKKITETFRSKFKAKPYQTGGADNKRCLIFSKQVLDKIGIYYDNPDKIEILSSDNDDDNTQKEPEDTSPTNSDGSSCTDIVLAGHIKNQSGNVETEGQGQVVTDVTNITDSNDAKALDNAASESSNGRNIENNLNNIDKISNSYNNIYDNVATTTLHSSSIWERGIADARTILYYLSRDKNILEVIRNGQPGSTSTTYQINPPLD
jgi:hypothetical protein